jgi:dTDP-4-dehydrorhamnose 3,5-epimerase
LTSNLLAVEGVSSLKLPKNQKGLGDLIMSPTSPKLIVGVKVAPIALWPDDRGYFLEIQRMRHGLAADFPLETSQVSAALNYPGTIKAFHIHFSQTDCWTPVMGMMQVVLCDLREESPTFGARNTLYVGQLRPWQILIPPRVAHGYKVVATDPAMLVYMTDRFYNPADEGRIVYNNPDINYDWETQYK